MKSIKNSLFTTIGVIIIIWGLFIVDLLPIIEFKDFGIRPRNLIGIIGIFTAPFLHGGFRHIISNTVPLFVLLLTTLIFYRKISAQVISTIVVLGGLGVWLFAGSNTNHIGASGLIFGLAAFLIAIGIFKRDIISIIIAVIIFIMYGSIFISGILGSIGSSVISWQGHLFGALAGLGSGYFFRKNNKNGSSKDKETVEEE